MSENLPAFPLTKRELIEVIFTHAIISNSDLVRVIPDIAKKNNLTVTQATVGMAREYADALLETPSAPPAQPATEPENSDMGIPISPKETTISDELRRLRTFFRYTCGCQFFLSPDTGVGWDMERCSDPLCAISGNDPTHSETLKRLRQIPTPKGDL